jgi:peptidoglycan/xylan/chitin deacetylase (PgdA/CDA1 family)
MITIPETSDPPAPRARRLLKEVGRRAAGVGGAGLSRLLGSRAGASFGILAYHRVAPRPERGPAPTWNVTPRRFRAQLEGLLAEGYRPLPLGRLLARGPLPRRAFAVTFDDGYECVHRHAWPVLRDLGVPATVFLATAYLDGREPFPFDDWAQAGSPRVEPASWRPLSTAQCAEMLAGGLVELGSHTHTHGAFRGRPEALAGDLAASLTVLRGRFGLKQVTFAFPYGVAGPALAAAARRAGVLCGLTTEPALVRPGSDPFAWGRFGVEDADGAGALAARLDGWFGLARAAWQRLGGTRGRSAG